ncbi:MAG: hypothetical protein A3H02_02950 [Candidatus Niyogibacteria bacterium RIFCSPLOWO2_12_FULL_41_13]|uniref:Uncharacterized protein n=1 Tax=Candidatus Niyogibacteria bacterium RIFCSPLOWO2_12_FULL_41_13 TaxID=1801726 RepID=A0A1G2F560_9BACT|nr:MAG: hypothetical protein A3H02_02950 [Candidatus Niyogibacteria bacterium RIFCSPLOWO2_12_FULL_41_13]
MPTLPAGVMTKLVAVEEPTTNWLVSPATGLTASFAQGEVVPMPRLVPSKIKLVLEARASAAVV